jgi:hypothetical protein
LTPCHGCKVAHYCSKASPLCLALLSR